MRQEEGRTVKAEKEYLSQEDAILRAMLLTFFLNGWTALFGTLLPFLRQAHGLNYELSGLLLSCKSVGNLAAMLGSGLLVLSLGRRRSVLLMTGGAAVSYLILASGLGSPALLMGACLLEGAAAGGIGNFSNTVISTLPGEKAARGFNLLHGSYAIGAFLSPLALAVCVLLWPRRGWQVMTGALCALCLVQMAVYARMALPPDSGGGRLQAADMSFLRDRQFRLGTLMIFFYLAVEYTILGWLVTYFQDAGVLSPQIAQLMNSLLWLLMFAGRALGAFLAGKVSRSAILVADGVGLLVCLLWMLSADRPWAVVLGLMGVGAFMATLYPTAFAFGSEHIKGNDLGCGVMNFIGAVGGAVAPALVGFTAERTGNIRSGMALVAVGTALLLGSILISVWSVRKKKTEGEENRA